MSLDPRLLAESTEELFDQAPCGFLLTSPDGVIARVNDTLLSWTGYTREWMLSGRRFRDLLTAPGRIYYETHYAPLLRMQGSIKEVALDLARPAAEPLPVIVNSSLKLDSDGSPLLVRTILIEATHRRKYEQELLLARRRAEQLAAVVQSAHDPIVILTHEGTIQTWNRGAEVLFGYSIGEAVGKNILELVPLEDGRDQLAAALRELLAHRPVRMEVGSKTKAGRPVDLLINLTPHANEAGEVTALAAVVQDITAQKQTEQRLDSAAKAERAARESAERAARIKDEFLATLSHELRTPLNAILGWTQLLQAPGMEHEDISEGLAVIERNGRVQSQLIDDLLDMSRIISGKLRLDVQQLDLAQVVDAAVETAMPAATARQIRVQKILDPNVIIMGDPARLQQVFWNLLGNAIKFTPKNGLIRVVMQRINSHVEVSIIDNGRGMSKEFLVVAFERFRQADSAAGQSTSGLGLGLSIVKTVVEMHGGHVEAHSDGEGLGSTFMVHLPVAVMRTSTKDAQRVHPLAATTGRMVGVNNISLAGIKVLVVDDERDAQEMVRRMLVGCGAEVRMASSVAEALDVMSDFGPDVVISDIGMPGEDGYSMIRRMRMHGYSGQRPFSAIALTAFARLEDRTQALLAGFNLHLAKPVEGAELIAAVANLSGRANDASPKPVI